MPTSVRLQARLAGFALLSVACATVPAQYGRRSHSSSAPAPEAVVRAPDEAAGIEISDPFPTQEALEEIATRPAPNTADLLGEAVAPVDAWTFRGPGAEVVGETVYQGNDPNASAIAAVLAQEPRRRRVTGSMQCVAREMGEFMLVHGDEPAPDIRGFISARCGSTVVMPHGGVRRMPIEEMPDRPLHPARDRQLLASMAEGIEPGASVGLWVGRGEDEGVLSLAWGEPDAELEPVVMSVEGRHTVELRGRMHWDYDNLSGYATRGELGALPCRPLFGEATSAPRFALRCPVSLGDDMTTVELSASPRGRLLGRRVLRVIVSARGPVPMAYQAPTLSLPVGSEQHDDVALAAAVSALRRKAAMSSVSAATGQSEVLADLFPHFLAASREADGQLADQIALGMMAGHRVQAEIHWGSFSSSTAPSNWPLERHLAAELSSPQSRKRLFDPEATTVAYATLSEPSHAMRRSIIATYAQMQDRDYTEDIVAFFGVIDRQRVARGNEPVMRIQGPADMHALGLAARRIREGEQRPGDALDDLLGVLAERTERSFRGMILAPFALDGWEPQLEGPLVTAPRVAVAVTVSHFRPPGSAWARHLVLVAFTEL